MPPQASLIEAFLKIVVPSSQVATLCQIGKKKNKNKIFSIQDVAKEKTWWDIQI